MIKVKLKNAAEQTGLFSHLYSQELIGSVVKTVDGELALICYQKLVSLQNPGYTWNSNSAIEITVLGKIKDMEITLV